MQIPTSKEATLATMSTVQSKVVVYSDGSGQNGKIGMAVVLYRHRVEQGSLRKQLGSEDLNTIFEAEVLSLSLAAKLISKERLIQSVVIRVDSQAMLLVAKHTRAAPGQYLLGTLQEQLKAMLCKHAGINIELR